MACEAGCCGSCVFSNYPGGDIAGAFLGGDGCKIWGKDPIVEETYSNRLCAKYQLNPAALED